MMKVNTILFVGGGSLGHVTPSIAVADAVRAKEPDTQCVFAVSPRPDETALVRESGYECHVLSAPKFPRGITYRYFTFPFSFLFSLTSALALLMAIRPQTVFAKGGFISVPVALVAWCIRIPIVLHTSDSVPNVSDRILMRIAKRVCTGFPLGELSTPHLHTGNPVRSFITHGSRAEGMKITGLPGTRPVLLVIGGSQGSMALNQATVSQLDALTSVVDVIHLTGAGKQQPVSHAGYWSRPEVTMELPHLYALADIVLTRAGAGTLSELASLSKMVIVTPLTGVAHDHQRLNAEYLVDAGAAYYLEQEQLPMLSGVVSSLLEDSQMRASMGSALATCFPSDAAGRVADVLLDASTPHA